MKKFKITLRETSVIEAENESEAVKKFWNNKIELLNDNNLDVEEI
jgi:hypothetical protein